MQVTSLISQGETSTCTERLLPYRTCLYTVSKVSFVLALGFAVASAFIAALSTVPTPIALIACASLSIGFVIISAVLALRNSAFQRERAKFYKERSVTWFCIGA